MSVGYTQRPGTMVDSTWVVDKFNWHSASEALEGIKSIENYIKRLFTVHSNLNAEVKERCIENAKTAIKAAEGCINNISILEGRIIKDPRPDLKLEISHLSSFINNPSIEATELV